MSSSRSELHSEVVLRTILSITGLATTGTLLVSVLGLFFRRRPLPAATKTEEDPPTPDGSNPLPGAQGSISTAQPQPLRESPPVIRNDQPSFEELQIERNRYEDLFSNINDFIYTHDLDGRFVSVNPAIARELGFQTEELVGRSVEEFIPERLRHEFSEYLRLIPQAGRARGLMRVIDHEGRDRVIEYDSSLIEEGGRSIGVRGIARDVTERVEWERRLRHQIEREALINRISRSIHQTFDIDEILSLSVEELGRHLKADRCVFFRIDEDTGGVAATHEFTTEGLSHAADRFDPAPLVEWLLEIEEPVLAIDQVQTDPRLDERLSDLLGPLQLKSLLIAKVIDADRLQAVLLLGMVGKSRDWRPDEAELIYAAASQVAMAVRQAKLYRQSQEASERESIINRISSAIHQSLDLDEVLKRAADELGFYLDADRCLFYVRSKDDEFVRVRGEYYAQGPETSAPLARWGEYPELIAEMTSGRTVTSAQPSRDESGRAAWQQYGEAGVQSVAYTPVIVDERLAAVIYLAQVRYPRVWSGEEIRLIEEVARHLAIALQKARLYESVLRSEEQYRSIFENASDGILIRDVETGRIVSANRRAAEIFGYSLNEYLQLTVYDLCSTEAQREDLLRETQQLRERRYVETNLQRRADKLGKEVILEGTATLQEHQGRPVVMAVFREVTERYRLEREAAARARRFAATNEMLEAISSTLGLDEMLRRIVHTLHDVFGSDRSWLLYPAEATAEALRIPYEITHPDYPGVFAQGGELPAADLRPAIERVLATHRAVALRISDLKATPFRHALEKYQVRSQLVIALRPRGSAPWLMGLHQCGSDRAWTEEERSLFEELAVYCTVALENASFYQRVSESEHKYRHIFENAIMGIFQTTPDGRVLTANAAAISMLGYGSLEDLREVDIARDLYVDASQRQRNLRILAERGILESTELVLRRPDGSQITVMENSRAVTGATGEVLYYEGTMLDVTEKKLLEQQLLQAQKMESIGMLAGGIAHDFNNLLTGILGYTSLILNQSSPGDRDFENLLVIEQSAKRAAELTAQLLAFSRRAITQKAAINLNELVDETVKLLRRSLGANIDLVTATEPELWPVEVDSAQIQQVLLNLCINARDAMSSGGVLEIATRNSVLDQDQCRAHLDLRPGRHVLLKVGDTGSGIAPEDLPKIFEPFYTTKETGKGTGLGLAMVYGIVKSHHGAIEVESAVGRGTAITVLLPATDKEITKPVRAAPRRAVGRETVLVVDDEPLVSRLAQAILEQEGYTVVTAIDGHSALEVFLTRRDEIDLVVLDLTMPRMSGHECFFELTKIRPDLKVLFSSGYSADGIAQELLATGRVRFVQKPYRADDLSVIVREMLDRK